MLLNELGVVVIITFIVPTAQLPIRNETARRQSSNIIAKSKLTNASSTANEDHARSLENIHTLSTNNRLILLTCKSKCSKHRAEISKWLEEYNMEYNMSSNVDIINYHFHRYIHPIYRYDIDDKISIQSPLLQYIVGPHAIHFSREIITKTGFWRWLMSLEDIRKIPNYRLISEKIEANELLDNVSHACENYSENIYGDYKDDENFIDDEETIKSYNESTDRYEYILEPATTWERRRLTHKTKKTAVLQPQQLARQYLYDNKTKSSYIKNPRTTYNGEHLTSQQNYNRKLERIDNSHRLKSSDRHNNVQLSSNHHLKVNERSKSVQQAQQVADTVDKFNWELRSRKALLVVHHPEMCPMTHLPNFARSLRDDENVTVAEARRPLTAEVDVIFRQRLLGIVHKCQMVVLMNNNDYVQLPSEITVTELYNFIKIWRSENEDACQSPFIYRIRPTLTDVEMIYYKEEVLIQRIEFSHAFVIVGIVGGLAVIALAISIFWGLNGTSFISK